MTAVLKARPRKAPKSDESKDVLLDGETHSMLLALKRNLNIPCKQIVRILIEEEFKSQKLELVRARK